MEQIKNNYQLNLVLPADLSETEYEKLLKDINLEAKEDEKREKQDSKIILAYPIKKRRQARFIVFEFKQEPEKAEKLKKLLEKQEAVLRFLLVKKPERKEKERAPRKDTLQKQEETAVKPEK